MKWVWDKTSRFRMRPHYSVEELDVLCESLLCDYLQKKHGKVAFPVATDDLRALLARETHELDLHDDAVHENRDLESLIEFRRGRRPIVRIAARLTRTPLLEHRLRAALAHACGHVRLHDFLFQTDEGSCLSLFDDFSQDRPHAHRCRRDTLFPLNEWDWMEWQAGFACGALLMPLNPLIAHVRHFRHARDLDHAAFSDHSLDGAALIREVAHRFQTSWESARIRLLQERILISGDTKSLF